ncbi:MAG: hypothetical protein ACTHKK_08125 [Candidatus Nitrosocosmicus sp.]
MKLGVFVHPKRPKISKKEIETIVKSCDIQIADSISDIDIALVVGGDGTFSYYGRNLSIPLLFIGVNEPDILGSKSVLAETTIDDIDKVLSYLKKGLYKIIKRKMISVKYNTFEPVDVLTDIYVERGIFAGCIRYTVSVAKNKIKETEVENIINNNNKTVDFIDFVIGNGVIISTAFGSTGYYSYRDKICNTTKIVSELFDDDNLGVCHILPTFAVRKKTKLKKEKTIKQIRYTVPFQSTININVMRDADVRLYGTVDSSTGVTVNTNIPIIITPSKRMAEIVHLEF